jgi:ABC-2 type transport system ATP-binding protein
MKAVLCRELRYTFGTTVAVDGIDLAVEEGEIFGLLGPNGAGKTTAIRLITTLLPAAPGMVEVFGRDVAANRMAVRRTIGYLPQQLSADSALTGTENVALFAGCSTCRAASAATGWRRCCPPWGSTRRPADRR